LTKGSTIRLRPNLEAIGITYEFGKHTNKGFTVELTRKPPPESWAENADTNDDIIFEDEELKQ